MVARKLEGFIWLVYPEFRRLRIPYIHNGHSFLDARLPVPSDGVFLGKSRLGPYFLVATKLPSIHLAAGWQAMPCDGQSPAQHLDPRCAKPLRLEPQSWQLLPDGRRITRCTVIPAAA